MNEEVRKQLEEMATKCIGVTAGDFFMSGAQAAWELATQGSQIIMGEFTATAKVLPVSEDDERDAEEYGNQIALPMIRSMYPTISRTEMSHHLAKAFLAGRLGLREAVQSERSRIAKLMTQMYGADTTRAALINSEATEVNPALLPTPAQIEAVRAAVEEERKRCAVIVSTFKHEDINAEARLTLARIQTSIIRPSKEGA